MLLNKALHIIMHKSLQLDATAAKRKQNIIQLL